MLEEQDSLDKLSTTNIKRGAHLLRLLRDVLLVRNNFVIWLMFGELVTLSV